MTVSFLSVYCVHTHSPSIPYALHSPTTKKEQNQTLLQKGHHPLSHKCPHLDDLCVSYLDTGQHKTPSGTPHKTK
ncbi:MAG: hypothetical protein CL920_10770 [Deltaproteobacteria bacterium]|nr:hypothetical protein [Deltaproteobacteria bacterium]MBU49169.1 hypothetical protein [Deltaproteobacteria bacterium]